MPERNSFTSAIIGLDLASGRLMNSTNVRLRAVACSAPVFDTVEVASRNGSDSMSPNGAADLDQRATS